MILYDLSNEYDDQILKLTAVSNLTHRKLFHILALFLYTPMHTEVMKDQRVWELLILSQNLVTVLFIYIEIARYSNQENWLGMTLNSAFLRFADQREVSGRRLMLTHIYLLIGLGISTNLTYILLDGGFPDGEMATFAYSGVVFLGVADTVAALAGKELGQHFWRLNAHNKSQEGTSWAILVSSIIYYAFCLRVHQYMCSLFAVIFFSTMIACIVEGWTAQYDNLVCPIVYFIFLHQFYDYFINAF